MNSTIAEKVVWSLALLGGLIWTIKHTIAISRQYESFKLAKARSAKQGRRLYWFNFPSLQLLAIGVLTTGPMMFGCGVMKIFSEYAEIGYDWGISLLLLGTANLGFVANVLAELRQFDAISKGCFKNPQDAKNLRKYLQKYYFGSVGVYVVCSTAAVLSGCIVGRSNPTESPQRFTLIIRNLSLAAFLFAMLKINKTVVEKTTILVNQMISSGITGSTASKESKKLEAVLETLVANSKAKMKTAILGTTLYSIFCIPPLWPYQTYPIGIIMAQFGITKNHYVHSYLQSTKSTKVTDSGMNSQGPSTTSVVKG